MKLKVVVQGEILPREFLQTLENNYLSLTIAKTERFKKFHHLKIWSILKALIMKLSIFNFPPRDFDKSLQIAR